MFVQHPHYLNFSDVSLKLFLDTTPPVHRHRHRHRYSSIRLRGLVETQGYNTYTRRHFDFVFAVLKLTNSYSPLFPVLTIFIPSTPLRAPFTSNNLIMALTAMTALTAVTAADAAAEGPNYDDIKTPDACYADFCLIPVSRWKP